MMGGAENGTTAESRTDMLWQLTHENSSPIVSSSILNRTHASTKDVFWVPAYWSSFIEHPESQQSTQAGVWLRLVVLPVILLFGFFGNGLTISLMARPLMQRRSYSPYLTALALSDSFALLIRLAFWSNLLALTFDGPAIVTFRSHGVCAVVEHVCTANHVLCSWLVVCLTFERLLVVVFPLKSARIVSASNSVKVVVVMVLSSCLLTCYIPAVVHWMPESGGCVIPFPLELYAHFALATTFVSLLPLLLICCGNLIIVVVLFMQSRTRARLLGWSSSAVKPAAKWSAPDQVLQNKRISDNRNDSREKTTIRPDYESRVQSIKEHEDNASSSANNRTSEVSSKWSQRGKASAHVITSTKEAGANSGSNDQQVRHVTFTLLCISLAFLVLVMPNALLVFVLGIRPDWSDLQCFLDPLALLWDMNFAINFYLYIFAGKGFRAEVLKMLRCRSN